MVGTIHTVPKRSHLKVLNAFRHHCGRHFHDGLQSIHNFCAQRLSASLWSAPERVSGLVFFGTECSTPFGITVVGTTVNRFSPLPPCSAQRLSASLWSALTWDIEPGRERCVLNAFRHHCGRHFRVAACRSHLGSCSTPFGITVVGTPSRCEGGISGRGGCAQRLSASLWSALEGFDRNSTDPGRLLGRAQRLSASLWSAR